VKLVRSKGVGIYFVTQNPLDLPESVLAQLGNRVQHALRAYTPREAKAVKTAAETFRPNPEFDTTEMISRLGAGEALVSTLGDGGVPSIVARTLVRPPSSRLGPITPAERTVLVQTSPVAGKYDVAVDRESAYEVLAGRAARRTQPQPAPTEAAGERGGSGFQIPDFGWNERPAARAPRASNRQTVAEAAIKSVVRSVGSSLGRALVRGILGSLQR
jgi:DNA helicase HerA-like ATPase